MRGTLNVWKKLVYFLRYAAGRLVRYVARADDVFVNFHNLYAYASLMRANSKGWIGSFEWYNIIPKTLRATGFGFGPKQSAGWGRLLSNCTRSFDADRCVGPYSFAKGPLLIITRPLLANLLDSPLFVNFADRHTSHKVVHDDVLLGVGVSHLSNVSYHWFPRGSWYDRAKKQTYSLDRYRRHPQARVGLL